MKKIVALLIASMMIVATMGIALAATVPAPTFTLKVENTDQNVPHDYAAYQIFKGDLSGGKLTNIDWGAGVKAVDLYTALLTSPSPIATALAAKNIAAADYGTADAAMALAEVLSTVTGTAEATAPAGALDVIASIIAANKSNATYNLTASSSGTEYTATVEAGYYIVIDVTDPDSLSASDGKSDTLSKSMLSVLEDKEITAKDTGLTPDKKILDGTNEVEENSAAIGDTVKFQVKVNVPDTRKYIDHFVFHMVDQLPAGLTYKDGSLGIKIDGNDFAATNYTTTVKTGTDTYAAPTDYVDSTGGQNILVVFNNFKAYVDANPTLIGKDIVITYEAVVNKNADFTPSGNENKVKFEYSNNPDHDYNGDDFESTDPKGETPDSKTKTYLTNLKIKKVDGNNAALAGAEFKIVGTTYNTALVTGDHYETWTTGTKYWELKDGTYTTTDPATTGINTSLYVDTSVVYQKSSYSETVVTPDPTTKEIIAISDSQGFIKLEGLNAGTYTITETSAPAGYNKIVGDKEIEITFANGTFSTTSTEFTLDTNDNAWTIEIVNKSGVELPSTGGIGTTIFYISGLVMVLGAAAILVARRKAEAE